MSKKKRVLKKGEKIVWIIRGETTRPQSISFPDAFRQDFKYYNTEREAKEALKKGGLFPVSHTHMDIIEGTRRTMRRQTHTDGDTSKGWNQAKKTKVQKLTQAGEAVDAYRKILKEGVYCGLCGNRMNIGQEAHIIGGKYYHLFNCLHQKRRI